MATGRLDPAFAKQKHLDRLLGPVKSSSARVASRIANGIRAGDPARDFTDFLDCSVVVIATRREDFAGVLKEMTASGLDWSGKTIAVLDGIHESLDLAPLAALGAMTASLEAVDGFDGWLFVCEGDARACGALRRVFGEMGSVVKEIQAGKKHCFTSGLELADGCILPLLMASMECFREAGLDTAVAWSVWEKTASNAIRGYRKAGRKAWGGVSASGDEELVRRQLRALGDAVAYRAAIELACATMGRDAAWISPLVAPARAE